MAAEKVRYPLIVAEVHTTREAIPLGPSRWSFPDSRRALPPGLVAVGGDFEPETVAAAYRAGAFPWPNDEEEYLWFSPDPRAVLSPRSVHFSRRLLRTIRRGHFCVTVDAAFDNVIALCSRAHEELWITPALEEGYRALHRLGWAHSFETWNPEGRLVGGVYGVALGALFGAESMFHLETDASKVAVAGMMSHLTALGVWLVDIQVISPHTRSLGGVEISRDEYLDSLSEASRQPISWVSTLSAGQGAEQTSD